MSKEKYSHRERMEMIAAGETPDRAAASVWRHFFHKESSVDGLVEAMLDYQKKYDWDFMKINPRASYHFEDWGSKFEWSKDEFQKHKTLKNSINDMSDWDRIEVLTPEAPVLSDHLKAISRIKKSSDPELPLLMTVFNPLGIARYMTGDKAVVLDHLNKDPNRVKTALENITVTFEIYVQECLNAGADGIFYATLEWASADTVPYEMYERLCRSLDLRILKATGDDAMNILHVCKSNNCLRELSDYPVKYFNWDAADPTNLNFESGCEFLKDKVVIAGLDHTGWLLNSTPKEIGNEVHRIKEKMTGKRFVFGPGCTISADIPPENIRAVRDSL